jgi:hypothetical protein
MIPHSVLRILELVSMAFQIDLVARDKGIGHRSHAVHHLFDRFPSLSQTTTSPSSFGIVLVSKYRIMDSS